MSKTTADVLPATNAMTRRNKILAFKSNPDLVAVVTFATIGLLITILFLIYLPLRFPDLGALIEQYDQF